MSEFKSLVPMVKSVITATIPIFTVTDAIRESVRKFCAETLLLEETVYVTVEKDTNKTDFYTSEGIAVEITEAVIDGELTPLTAVDRKTYSTGQGKPTGYSSRKTGSLTVYPTPDQDYELVLTVAIKPYSDATKLDNEMLDEYAEIIRDGAIAVLYAQAGNAWHNPNAAMQYEHQFEAAIHQLRIDLDTGLSGAETVAYGDKW